MNRKVLSILSFALLIFALPILIIAAQKVQKFVGRALGTPATIVVETQKTLEPISASWNSYAQGGEEKTNILREVTSEIRSLNPEYIRIDHIYDFYDVVSKNGGSLSFNFAQLDAVIDSILATGAKPLIALSYMPPAIAIDGNVTNPPTDWNDWTVVIQRTIEHYSGRGNKNIANVYYEVWNEPDLFGNWKVWGDKNYLTLYSRAATGANQAQNTNTFKLGGPATTGLYKNWITALLKHATENNLRVDFLSWHRYSLDPRQYAKDIRDSTKWSFDYPLFTTIPKLVTEWGFDSDINAGYDGSFAAAHTVATARQTLVGLTQLYAFELVDGLDPSGNKYWGRWGLMTHPTKDASTKPRYNAFSLLNRMTGNRVSVKGEGTWVTGFAAKQGDTIRLILANYDSDNTHSETVPITFTGLDNGTYKMQQTLLPGTTISLTQTVTERAFQTSVFMPKSSVLLLELTPS